MEILSIFSFDLSLIGRDIPSKRNLERVSWVVVSKIRFIKNFKLLWSSKNFQPTLGIAEVWEFIACPPGAVAN